MRDRMRPSEAVMTDGADCNGCGCCCGRSSSVIDDLHHHHRCHDHDQDHDHLGIRSSAAQRCQACPEDDCATAFA